MIVYKDTADICEVRIFTLGLSDFYNTYKSPTSDSSVMKGIPNTAENINLARRILPHSKIMWRGGSTETYKRPQSYCHKSEGTTFAIYRR